MDLCRDFLTLFLSLFNLALIVFGAVIAGIGIYLSVNIDGEFDELDADGPIIASIVFGFGLIVFALIGCFGVCKDSKLSLVIYLIGIFAMGLGVLVVGGVLYVLSAEIDSTRDGSGENSEQELILDLIYASAEECCGIDVNQCAGNDNSFCIFDQERVDGLRTAMADNDFCDALNELEFEGHPLASEDNSDGSCGGGDLSQFVSDVATFIEDNLKMVALADVLAGVFILVLIVGACYLLWNKDTQEKKKKRTC